MMIEGKPELGFIKIPFKNEESANELKEAFGKDILFLDEKWRKWIIIKLALKSLINI